MTFLLFLGTSFLILVLAYRRPAVCCLMLALEFGVLGVYFWVADPFPGADTAGVIRSLALPATFGISAVMGIVGLALALKTSSRRLAVCWWMPALLFGALGVYCWVKDPFFTSEGVGSGISFLAGCAGLGIGLVLVSVGLIRAR